MTSAPTILVIDDEAALRRLIAIACGAHGYRVVEAATVHEGRIQAAMSRPDVILLDLALPDGNGADVLASVRSWTATPVIVLTANDDADVKVRLLDDGADDYLTKPFDTGELLARIRVAMRHATVPEARIVTSGELGIDLVARTVTVSGADVHLTETEYDVLAFLARHAGKVVTHAQILRAVRGPGAVDDLAWLRVFVRQLRKKIERDPAQPDIIRTETGVGYRLMVREAETGTGVRRPDHR